MPTIRTAATAVLLASAFLASACTNDDAVAELPNAVRTDGTTTTMASSVDARPCDGAEGVGSTVPAGSSPGDLIAAHDLADDYDDTAGYPTDARTWRILYVSTGADETDLQLVCGMVAAPSDGPSQVDGSGRALSWAHGTIGLQQACLPSNDPAAGLWGQMPGGIGAPAWGSAWAARSAEPADGLLQTALDRGWVVSATDYQPNDTYVIGRVAAANVIDATRAATQLMASEFGDERAPDRYDTLVAGHSQGGHAALWAGQLFEAYQDGAPSPDSARLTLAGVAAEAPASNFVAQPDEQPDVALGDGLADWEMHKSIELVGLPIPALELQIGPALFSYIFGSWTQFSARSPLAADAELPAYPADAAPLQIDAVASPQGQTTIARVAALCLDKQDSSLVKRLVAPYRNAATDRLLVDDLWNLPDDYRPGQFFRGGVDRTCARAEEPTSADTDMAAWCAWIRWNLPGPLGDHPFPTFPSRDGEPAPVLIVQGSDDEVIHCQPVDGADASDVPPPSDCMSTALFDSMRDADYCPSGQDRGHLQLAVFRAAGAGSPASHLSIPGQIAAVGNSKDPAELSFVGSRLDRFITGAFDGTLVPGCRAEVLNPD
jgi:hypothetical protein